MVNPNATRKYPIPPIDPELPSPGFGVDPVHIPDYATGIRNVAEEGTRPRPMENFQAVMKSSGLGLPSDSSGVVGEVAMGEVKTISDVKEGKYHDDDSIGTVTSADYEDEHNHSHHDHVCSQPSK